MIRSPRSFDETNKASASRSFSSVRAILQAAPTSGVIDRSTDTGGLNSMTRPLSPGYVSSARKRWV